MGRHRQPGLALRRGSLESGRRGRRGSSPKTTHLAGLPRGLYLARATRQGATRILPVVVE